MGRRVFDTAMRRLQIHIDYPLVQHLAKCAQHNDGVLGRIVLVALKDTAECGSRISVHQIVIHSALESFKLAFVPGNENFRVLDIGPDLEARSLEMAGVELGWIIHDHKFRYAVAFPGVLDGKKLRAAHRSWEGSRV